MDKTCRKMDIKGNPSKYRFEIHDYLKIIQTRIYNGFVFARKFRWTTDKLQIKNYSCIPKDSLIKKIRHDTLFGFYRLYLFGAEKVRNLI